MKNCVFRSLTEKDDLILSSFGHISCGLSDICTGKYLYSHKTLEEPLNFVNYHLTQGSKVSSFWISCSKSFITDVEKYTLSTKGYEMLLRPKIAVIRNHRDFEFSHDYSQEEILSIFEKSNNKNIRSFQANRVTKMVLDASDTSGMLELFNRGLLRNVDGIKSKGGAMALNFARSSDEVLVFRDIPKISIDSKINKRFLDILNIPVVLTPLAYDILYSLIKTGSISEDDDYHIMYKINKFVSDYDNFWDLLTDNEKDFYRHYYRDRMQMRTILKSVDSKVIDYISLYVELNGLKRSILEKIIKNYNLINGTNYCTDPYLLFDKNEMIDNNANPSDIELDLGYSKRLIRVFR